MSGVEGAQVGHAIQVGALARAVEADAHADRRGKRVDEGVGVVVPGGGIGGIARVAKAAVAGRVAEQVARLGRIVPVDGAGDRDAAWGRRGRAGGAAGGGSEGSLWGTGHGEGGGAASRPGEAQLQALGKAGVEGLV